MTEPLDPLHEGWITLNEAAQEFGYHPSSFRHAIRRGRLPEARKIGRDWIVPRDAIARIASRRRKGAHI